MEKEKGTAGSEYKTLTLDVEYYQSLLDDVDISEEQKQEFIETMWAIMVQFVDMGFGIEATQLALDSKLSDRPELSASSAIKISKEFEIC